MAKRKKRTKGVSLNIKIFVIIAIILGLAIILSGIPEVARFAAPQAGIGPAPIPSACSGNPNPCDTYEDLDSCVNLAGCAFVESQQGMACTNLEGPASCDSYSNQADCSKAGCEWQVLAPQPALVALPTVSNFEIMPGLQLVEGSLAEKPLLADQTVSRTAGACNPPASGTWLIDGTQNVDCDGIDISGPVYIVVLDSASARFANSRISNLPGVGMVVDDNAKLIFENVLYKGGLISVQGGVVNITGSNLEYAPTKHYTGDGSSFADVLKETPFTASLRIIEDFPSTVILKDSKASILFSLGTIGGTTIIDGLRPGVITRDFNFGDTKLNVINSEIYYIDIQTFAAPAFYDIRNSQIRILHFMLQSPDHNKINLLDSSIGMLFHDTGLFYDDKKISQPFEILENIRSDNLPVTQKVKDLATGNIYTSFELNGQNSKIYQIGDFCVTNCQIKNSKLDYYFDTIASET